MNGCGDCKLSVDGKCPHTGDACGDFSTRDVAEAGGCRHITVKPGPRTGTGDIPTEICRDCKAYRLLGSDKWREGPVPEEGDEEEGFDWEYYD